jgi:hypothetical protein
MGSAISVWNYSPAKKDADSQRTMKCVRIDSKPNLFERIHNNANMVGKPYLEII